MYFDPTQAKFLVFVTDQYKAKLDFKTNNKTYTHDDHPSGLSKQNLSLLRFVNNRIQFKLTLYIFSL